MHLSFLFNTLHLSHCIYHITFITLHVSYYHIAYITLHLSHYNYYIYQIAFITLHLSDFIYQIAFITLHLSHCIYQIAFITLQLLHLSDCTEVNILHLIFVKMLAQMCIFFWQITFSSVENTILVILHRGKYSKLKN